jgi:hypothetical protein
VSGQEARAAPLRRWRRSGRRTGENDARPQRRRPEQASAFRSPLRPRPTPPRPALQAFDQAAESSNRLGSQQVAEPTVGSAASFSPDTRTACFRRSRACPVAGSVRDSMLRYLGTLLVLLGCLLLAVDGTRWDRLILSFGGSGHGLHMSEVLGLGMAVIGVAALWTRRG